MVDVSSTHGHVKGIASAMVHCKLARWCCVPIVHCQLNDAGAGRDVRGGDAVGEGSVMCGDSCGGTNEGVCVRGGRMVSE